MHLRIIILTSLIFYFTTSYSQTGLKSGPWAGNVALRNATIWAEVTTSVKTVSVKYYQQKNPVAIKIIAYKGTLGNEFNPIKIELNGLDINTEYIYQLIIDGKPITTSFTTSFTTKDLWQHRKPAPDFSFLAGSCAYFNEPIYDRPGKPYGGDSSIFETMAKTPAAFHVWMGDNWYTREVDYNSPWGLYYRASRDRGQKILQQFMAKMPQYAIWDDHDYGPNDAGKSYILKEESREIFKKYSLNPSYGEEGKGIYTKVSYGDVDVFLTDDRYFRSEDEMPDSIDGKPSSAKAFFGAMQMEWLKNALLFSDAPFKIIVVGSQVLNPLNPYEGMDHYSYEFNDLMNFIASQKISGIVFFTGDRHHSEVIKKPREGLYTLYDVTISPYTSGISKVKNEELNNPFRISNTLVEAQNFGKISFSGEKNKRMMKVEFIGTKGEKLGEWSVTEAELKTN
ncbi:MAG: alkaline phosphatase D family protein [Ferruginibacter sp.]